MKSQHLTKKGTLKCLRTFNIVPLIRSLDWQGALNTSFLPSAYQKNSVWSVHFRGFTRHKIGPGVFTALFLCD